MSRPQTYEQSLLSEANFILTEFSSTYEERLLVIEACASMYSKFCVEEYWKVFDIFTPEIDRVKETAKELFLKIAKINITPSLIISSLAREPISVSEKKKQGAFYTDFRLAEFIANDCVKYLKKNCDVADIAVGSGILLAGVAERYFEKFPQNYDEWIAEHVFAYDLSENALRGARIALSIRATSIESLKKMNSNWAVCDSLTTDIIPNKFFDIVVGNPPWGKVKLSLHSFVNNNGVHHVYGSEFADYDKERFLLDKQSSLEYSRLLKEKYALLSFAEPDMYMAFLQRAIEVLKKGGHLSYIVPAGLIRSQGTETLRRYLLKVSRELKYYMMDNKARFFEIDSRFKFVVISQEKASLQIHQCETFILSTCTVDKMLIYCGDEIVFNVSELETIRSDLTIPECRNVSEKDLFIKICKNGRFWKNEWSADISREVDMTNNKSDFYKHKSEDCIPVIEGRMVQQYRFGAKAYISGSGRSAKWVPCTNRLQPQFYIRKEKLSEKLQERIKSYRVGYCDIAGQTNERAMMSAIIPPEVVCGNKVPTIRFCGDKSDDYMYFWIGVTNSFVFDWILRRIITTTVNYFLLFSLPMPNIEITSELAKTIISKSKELSDMDDDYYTGDKMASLRAEIDVCVAKAYRLSFADLELIMRDFPLLDRSQTALKTEKRSTVTRDLILSLAEREYKEKECIYSKRYKKETELSVKAYIPTEMTELCGRRKNYGTNNK